MTMDRQGWEAVRTLERLGWKFDGSSWNAPSATMEPDLSATADAMHAYLMERADQLAGASGDSLDDSELAQIGELIEVYESERWPTGMSRR